MAPLLLGAGNFGSMFLEGLLRRWHRLLWGQSSSVLWRSQAGAFWHRIFGEQVFFVSRDYLQAYICYVAAMFLLKGFQRKTAPLLWGFFGDKEVQCFKDLR
jgi:hypothetical protein